MDMFTEKLMECIRRRDAAKKHCRPCKLCGSEQVQLVDWLGENFKYRCRKCANEWKLPPVRD